MIQEKKVHHDGNRNTEPGGRVGLVPRKCTVWPMWLGKGVGGRVGRSHLLT